jgi:predicted nucleic acid-binding protein
VRFLEEGLDVKTVTEIRSRLASVTLVVITETMLHTAETFPFQLKTLDALHLATAVELMPDLDALATKDKQMRHKAALLGLPLLEDG